MRVSLVSVCLLLAIVLTGCVADDTDPAMPDAGVVVVPDALCPLGNCDWLPGSCADSAHAIRENAVDCPDEALVEGAVQTRLQQCRDQRIPEVCVDEFAHLYDCLQSARYSCFATRTTIRIWPAGQCTFLLDEANDCLIENVSAEVVL
jgi:hypothetical protein